MSTSKYPITQPVVESRDFLEEIKKMRDGGYRLVQISCTRTEGFELTYSFDKDYALVNMRINIGGNEEFPSITDFYQCAFLYENELVTQFGIKFTGLSVDYDKKFYKVSRENAFNTKDNKTS